jgi:hypothetical protein
MSCAGIERWLNQGGSGADLDPALRAHAALCPRCAQALAAAAALDDLLAAAPASPAGLTAGVMARVAHAESAARVAPAAPEAPALPWWAEAAAEPACALALIAAALLAWQAGSWEHGAPAVIAQMQAWATGLQAVLAARLSGVVSPQLLAAQSLALLPAILLLVPTLYGAAERRTRRLASAVHGARRLARSTAP